MTRLAVFHGTDQEARDLAQAVSNNCFCDRKRPCEVHTMILNQKTLDFLLYWRRVMDQYTEREH